MSQSITKSCFPPASKCHNCERKCRGDTTEAKQSGELKRCSGCHLMTYCDKDCQKEHWNAVHKHHCKFLSGSKVVTNSKHNRDSCTFCTDEKKASDHEIRDIKSPKTGCHIEHIQFGMNTLLGSLFEFHREGKTCKCSINFGCRLPFSLGEVSGEYVGGGLEGMVAHAIRLVNAIGIKINSDIGLKKNIDMVQQMLRVLVEFRSLLWYKVLVLGHITIACLKGDSCKLLEDVETILGFRNPWCKAIQFSKTMIIHLCSFTAWSIMDVKNFNDPRFQTMRKMYQYDEAQINNISLVSQNNLWAKLKMWPMLKGGKLVLHLPEGIRCDSCNTDLKGEFTISVDQINILPLLSPFLSSEGSVAICSNSTGQNPTCYGVYAQKNPKIGLVQNKNEQKKYDQEMKLYLSKTRPCDVCLKSSFSAHRCSDCLAAQYCSTKCQKKDLDFHRTVCSDWDKNKYKKMMSSSQQRKVFNNLIYKKY